MLPNCADAFWVPRCGVPKTKKQNKLICLVTQSPLISSWPQLIWRPTLSRYVWVGWYHGWCSGGCSGWCCKCHGCRCWCHSWCSGGCHCWCRCWCHCWRCWCHWCHWCHLSAGDSFHPAWKRFHQFTWSTLRDWNVIGLLTKSPGGKLMTVISLVDTLAW